MINSKEKSLIKSPWHWTLYGVLFLITVGLYLHLTFQYGFVKNTDSSRTDQKAYLEDCRYWVEYKGSLYFDRNRMPLYPILLGLFCDPKASSDKVFEKAKGVSIYLSLFYLLIMLLFFPSSLSPPFKTCFFLISIFHLWIYRAPYTQAELLFFSLSFMSFGYMWLNFQKNDALSAFAGGALLSLAFLSKASALLLFVSFLLVKMIQSVKLLLLKPIPYISLKKTLLSVLILGGVFFLCTGKYLLNSKKYYGRYFYNVNSTFYFWYDNWTEAINGTSQHGDLRHWPKMKDEDIPSMEKYLREHTFSELIRRISYGTQGLIKKSIPGTHFFIYPLLLFLLLPFVARRRSISKWAKKESMPLIFGGVYGTSYFLCNAWYYQLSGGARFLQGLFLPLLWALLLVHQNLNRQSPSKTILKKQKYLLAVLFIILLGHLIFYLRPHLELHHWDS